jgi:hypothetical protein
MKTIVHIGQHKTGTTSLQHFLAGNRSQLANKGIYIPTSIVGVNDPSHYMLNVFALDKHRYSPMKELLKSKKEPCLERLDSRLPVEVASHYEKAAELGCSSVIWSNEGLYLLNSTREYERLYGLFSEHSSQICAVCCFRDVESYRESYKKQLMKTSIEFSEDPDSYRYISNDSWLFDYERKRQLLDAVFDDVKTFDYDKEDNIRAFFSCLNLSMDGTKNYRKNVTEGKQPSSLFQSFRKTLFGIKGRS